MGPTFTRIYPQGPSLVAGSKLRRTHTQTDSDTIANAQYDTCRSRMSHDRCVLAAWQTRPEFGMSACQRELVFPSRIFTASLEAHVSV
jgi:hypothetical protein